MSLSCEFNIGGVVFDVSFTYESDNESVTDIDIESINIGEFEVSDIIAPSVYDKIHELCKAFAIGMESDVRETNACLKYKENRDSGVIPCYKQSWSDLTK